MRNEMELIDTELINEDEIVLHAEMLLGNIGNSIPKRIKAIESICADLVELSPAKQEVYVNEITSQLSVTKKELSTQLKETLAAEKA